MATDSENDDEITGILADMGGINTVEIEFGKTGRRIGHGDFAKQKEKEGNPGWAEEIRKRGEVMLPIAISTAANMIYLIYDFIEWVAANALDFVGKELSKEGISDRVRDYLSSRVEMSLKTRLVGGQNVQSRMSWGSVVNLRWDLERMLKYKAAPRLSAEEFRIVAEDLRLHAQNLKAEYELSSVENPAVKLGKFEVGLILEEILKKPKSWETALQDAAMVLFHFNTFARPGSLMPTQHYSYYITWKNVEIRPEYIAGEGEDEGRTILLGFHVIIKLDTFKGYQYLQSRSATFHVRPVTSEHSMLFDLGSILVATLLRLDAIEDYDTLDELWSDGPSVLKIKSEFLDVPVFRTRTSRNTLHPTQPLTAAKARTRLRSLVTSSGMRTSGQRITFYGPRKAGLTAVANMYGTDVARRAAMHRADSTTLEERYYQGDLAVDLAAAVLGEDAIARKEWETLAMTRGAAPERVTGKQAIKEDIICSTLATTLSVLKFCRDTGDNSWTRMPAYAKMQNRPLLPVAIARLEWQFRRRLGELQEIKRWETDERNANELRQMDYAETLKKLEALGKGSKLPEAMIRQWETLAKDQARYVPPEELSIDITIDDDEPAGAAAPRRVMFPKDPSKWDATGEQDDEDYDDDDSEDEVDSDEGGSEESEESGDSGEELEE